MRTINLYFRKKPLGYKYIPGDKFVLSWLRKQLGLRRVSGVEKVFISLRKGFDELKIDYTVNKPFHKIKPGEAVVVLGDGKYSLQGYNQPNPVIAGIGLMTHPNEWPDLFTQYPVARYLQHSDWTNAIYARHFGTEKCAIWPAGIDVNHWQPELAAKTNDILVYNKIMWNKPETNRVLRNAIIEDLEQSGISYKEITYGSYTPAEYKRLLAESKAMIFLCEHESQGFACCEAMSMNVPVFAWDQGSWLDPKRFEWGDPSVPATSVPFFDARCGSTFRGIEDFNDKFKAFWNSANEGSFAPRTYILENLTLKKSAERMLEIINGVYQ